MKVLLITHKISYTFIEMQQYADGLLHIKYFRKGKIV